MSKKIIRKIITFLLKYSFSKKIDDLLLWPVSKRLFSNYSEIVETKKGLKIKVYGDMEDMVNKILLFSSKYVNLAWEPGTARLIDFLANRSKVSVVAGSHIGYYPLIIGSNNPGNIVYALEPNPNNFIRCKENVKLNNLDNIKVIEKALGKNIGKEKMYFDFGQSSLVSSSREHKGEGLVNVTTLDQLAKEIDKPIDLVILDAEGYEENIILGGENLLKINKPTIIFELNEKALVDAGSSSKKLTNLLLGQGYSLFVIDEGSHKINFDNNVKIKLVPINNFNFLGSCSFVNVVAIIDIKLVNQYVYKE